MPKKSTQKKSGKKLSFNISVVDQSIDCPVEGPLSLNFDIPVISLPSGFQHFSTAKEAKRSMQIIPKIKRTIEEGTQHQNKEGRTLAWEVD